LRSHPAGGRGAAERPEYYDELTIEQKAALERPNHHSRRPKQVCASPLI